MSRALAQPQASHFHARRSLCLSSTRSRSLSGGSRIYRETYSHFRRQPSQRSALGVRCLEEVTEASFESEVLQSDVPVLVDFWAEWCGPCKLITPCVEWVGKEFGAALKVVKVETDGNPGLISKYKVHGLPTLILIKDGEYVEGSRHEGAVTKKFLQDYLEKRGVMPVKA